jgi:hypothetical protein
VEVLVVESELMDLHGGLACTGGGRPQKQNPIP